MKPEVLIVGAGVAGLNLAVQLTRAGVPNLLVERGPFPGGHTADLPCQATRACAKCGACLLEETLTAATGLGVKPWFRAPVTAVKPEGSGYRIRLVRGPCFLDPERCLDCGLCHRACPRPDEALLRAGVAFSPHYDLAAEQCLHFAGEGCQACAQVCPVGAIDLSARSEVVEIEARVLALATGFTPFPARLKPRFGYGRLRNVVTAADLDHALRRTGNLARPSDGAVPRRVAFIQCVGSRDRALGRDYCSRVCCGYALRLACLIQHRWPRTQVTLYYMDLQTVGRDFENYYREIAHRVELIQGIPGEITADGEELLVPVVTGAGGAKKVNAHDMVVLSVGQGPPDLGPWAELDLALDRDGFPQGRPEAGLFVAGAAAGPRGVAESVDGAALVATQVAEYLSRRRMNLRNSSGDDGEA